MFDRLVGLKNILWAIGIVLCLILLFVGFIFSAVTPYHGEVDPRTPDLNAVRKQNAVADVSTLEFVEPDGELHLLRESQDAGEDYIRSSVFLTDSILVALRDQSLTGGDVWSSSSGSLSMANIATWNILYSDGSKISPADACMIARPKRLIIAVGSDGLASTTKNDFISGYEDMIRAIQRVSPDTQIICCSALLTTTMGVMEEVVKKAVEAGIRDKVKIMIGGAPVDEAFCEKIGADKYTPDAASAADAAAEFCASMV